MTMASAIKQILLLAFLQKWNNYDAQDIKYASNLSCMKLQPTSENMHTDHYKQIPLS